MEFSLGTSDCCYFYVSVDVAEINYYWLVEELDKFSFVLKKASYYIYFMLLIP